MRNKIDILLLLALPASGKSEVRRYIEFVDSNKRLTDFRISENVQLDDYPYVHTMRRIDDEIAKLGKERIFFLSPDKPFRDPFYWLTLIELINEDYADLTAKRKISVDKAGQWLLGRIDSASQKTGAARLESKLDDATISKLVDILEEEALEIIKEKNANIPDSVDDKTIIIEFARGGPDGASMPLSKPLGYQHSLAQLSEEILSKASILYIWVTPEESRRKNEARTDPNDPGSILHHGVPLEVMLSDYGCDDIEWLIKSSNKQGSVIVNKSGREFILPIARFDNRVDKTSFLRDDVDSWKPENINAVYNELKRAMCELQKVSKYQ